MPEKKFKRELIKQAAIEPNSKVLDFGCGTMTLTLMAAEIMADAEYYAVDVDEKILSIANEKLKHSNKRFDVRQYDGTTLPFADNIFDRVISSLVFHHLTAAQKENSLKEIFRVLKPLGELHIADWGKAKNSIARAAFYAVQLLDGFETTTDNVLGRLPDYMSRSGFSPVSELKTFPTAFGTLSLYKAVVPGSDKKDKFDD